MRRLSVPLLLLLLAPAAAAHEPVFTGEQAEQVLGFFRRVEDEPLEQLTVELGPELDAWQSRLALIPTDELTHLMHARQAAELRADKKRAAERLLTAVRAFRLVQPLGKHAAEVAVAVAADPTRLTPLLCYEEPRTELFSVMGDLLAEKSARVRWAVLDAVLRLFTFEQRGPSAGHAAACRALILRGLSDVSRDVRARTACGLLQLEWDWAAWPVLQTMPLWTHLAGQPVTPPDSDRLDAWQDWRAAQWMRRQFQARWHAFDETAAPAFTEARWRALLARPAPPMHVLDVVARVSVSKLEVQLETSAGPLSLRVSRAAFGRVDPKQIALRQERHPHAPPELLASGWAVTPVPVLVTWSAYRLGPDVVQSPGHYLGGTQPQHAHEPQGVRGGGRLPAGPALWALPSREPATTQLIRVRLPLPPPAK